MTEDILLCFISITLISLTFMISCFYIFKNAYEKQINEIPIANISVEPIVISIPMNVQNEEPILVSSTII